MINKENIKQESCLNNITEIMDILVEKMPHPEIELDYSSDFTLLVAIVLSAQSTDVAVNKATRKLFEVADNPQKIKDLGKDNLIGYIRTLGLFNNKADNIIKLANILIDQYNGAVPLTSEELEALPGVGRKSSNVFLNVMHKKPLIGVDTHISRVSQRLGLSDGKTPLKIEQDLMKVIPDKYLLHAHHYLVLHGRYTCTAKKPKCDICNLKQFCRFYNSNHSLENKE